MDAFWSVAAMPIGLLLCFTPVLIAWVGMVLQERSGKKKPDNK
jgi:hypothetical protein